MNGLFDEQRWSGIFFAPDQFESRFSGELQFSYERGVTLSYNLVGPKSPEDSLLLHGVLSSGDRCTLIGKFPLGRPGISMRNGLVTRPGVCGFPFLAIGNFLEENSQCQIISFTVTGLHNFFGTNSDGDFAKFSMSPIYDLKTDFGRLEVRTAGTFAGGLSDISTKLFSANPEANAALENRLNELEEQFPTASFMIRKSLSYRFVLHFESPKSIHDAFSYVSSISDLFSLLSHEPVFPLDIKFTLPEDDRRLDLKLYPHSIANSRTIEISKTAAKKSLPISVGDLPFETVLSNWLIMSERFSVVVSGIKSQTGLTSFHETLGDIVLYATQFESISHEANEKKKYEFPLTSYADPIINSILEKIFNIYGVDKVGIAISELRNEIAHVGRPKHWINILNFHELISISQCLEAVVLSYVMITLDVPKLTTFNYQRQIVPD